MFSSLIGGSPKFCSKDPKSDGPAGVGQSVKVEAGWELLHPTEV